MDYDSVQDGAYNTKLDATNALDDDLQDIEPKAYQKSEVQVKDRISMKTKSMKEMEKTEKI